MNNSTSTPRLISWSSYLAITLLLILPLSVLIVRSGNWQQGLLLYAVGCLGATGVIVLCIVLLLIPACAAHRPAILKTTLISLPGVVLTLSLVTGGSNPPIHDVTTDTLYPPTFSSVVELRDNSANSLDIDPDTLEQQKKAYGDLTTLVSELDRDQAFARAIEVASSMGWKIVAQDSESGLIEAVATSNIMAFKDDVVIRLQQGNGTTLIDLRSASRVGVSDLGANARRIMSFQDQFNK
jgi:uncharacterized protein (DUF1499 family)